MSYKIKEKRKMGIIARVFMVIGIIFSVLILLVIVLAIIKPYGIDVVKVAPAVLDNNPKSSYDHPYLNTKQEAILESAGIDPSTVPTEITLSQQKCAISILGEARVNEIVGGDTPSVVEVLKVKDCLNK